MDRLFIRVRGPVDQVGRGRSVGIKRSGQKGERRIVEAYSMVQPIFLVSIPRHSFGRSLSLLLSLSLFLFLSPTSTCSRSSFPDATISDGASLLPVYRNADKKVHGILLLCVLRCDRHDRNCQ